MKTTHRIAVTDAYLKDAQRLSIAQNRALKLIYQTWWVWWVPRVLLAAMTGFLLMYHLVSTAALFGTFLLFTVWAEWFARRSLAKARNNVRAKGTTSVVAIDEQGIKVDGAHGNSQFKWSAVLHRVIYDQGVLLRFSRFSALWLPDEALTEGSAADVRALLAANPRDSAVGGL